jgi:putative ABC transport system permease protein
MTPGIIHRLRRFLRREDWETEREREIHAHLEIETEENIARGMTPAEARDAAHRKFGNVTLVREEIYHMNSLGFLETLWQDLHFALRLLRRNPGFAAAAILSLALGIGANTALFELLNSVRMRTLPVKNPGELVHVKIEKTRGCCFGSFTGRYSEATFPIWEAVRDRQQAFSGLLAWGPRNFNLSRGGEIREARGIWVSGNYFDVLGVQPLIGRVFGVADDHPDCGASSGAVISYGFWQQELGGTRDVLSKTVWLEGHPFPIIGVTPSAFFGLEVGRSFEVAVPLCAEPFLRGENSLLARRDGWWITLTGRLHPGWSVERATSQLRAISPDIFRTTLPASYDPERARKYSALQLSAFPGETGVSSLRTEYEQPLWLLLGLAGLVLLIACANLANLMLARAAAREREIGVRLVVGASRLRLIRQLLAESLLLAAFGAGAGIWLASVLSRFLVAFLSTPDDPLFMDLALDWRVIGFTASLAVLTCLLFGLAPALRATSFGPGEALKSGGRGSTVGRRRFGLRRVLVATQVALTLVLLVGALLFSRSLRNLLTVDPGFRPVGILGVEVSLGPAGIPQDRLVAYKRQLQERIRAIPGVASVADADILPISGYSWDRAVDTKTPVTKGATGSLLNRVGPGFFRTVGTPLLAGRDFDPGDRAGTPLVAIVNQVFAQTFLGVTNPVGQSFRLKEEVGKQEPYYEIVGLVENTKYNDLRENFPPIAYFPVAQDPEPDVRDTYVIRSDVPLGTLRSRVNSAIQEANPEIRVGFTVMQTMVQDSLLRERLMATLSGFFGLLAGVLATIGIYGVISYMVAQRRSEIGIRMALGANPLQIIGMIIREAVILLGTGLVVGTLITLAAIRTVGTLLFGLQPDDPPTLLMAAALLAAVGAVASYLPALRASRLDPTEALRSE